MVEDYKSARKPVLILWEHAKYSSPPSLSPSLPIPPLCPPPLSSPPSLSPLSPSRLNSLFPSLCSGPCFSPSPLLHSPSTPSPPLLFPPPLSLPLPLLLLPHPLPPPSTPRILSHTSWSWRWWDSVNNSRESVKVVMLPEQEQQRKKLILCMFVLACSGCHVLAIPQDISICWSAHFSSRKCLVLTCALEQDSIILNCKVKSCQSFCITHDLHKTAFP